jgi:H+/Cl- antiporter ClcA
MATRHAAADAHHRPVSHTSGDEQQPISGQAYLRLIALGAAIGIPAALLAAIFQVIVHGLVELLWHDLPSALGYATAPWFLVTGLPVVGAAFVFLARRRLPGDGGHHPIEGLSAEPTPVVNAPGVALAAVGTLAFGAVLGPEAPLIALGSAVGMAMVPFVRLDAREARVIATAGSFSAIAALFGGPLVAGLLLVEAGLDAGARLIPTLLPGLVAAAIGFTVFIGLGSWAGLGTVTLAVPSLPPYEGTSVVDLLVGIAVGVAAALLIALIRRLATALAGPGERRLGPAMLLVGGGLAVGLLAQAAALLGADPQDVLFSGQASLPDLVAMDTIGVLVVVGIAKAAAYAVSLGCGFRGGPVFPAMFLGVVVATVPVIAFGISPTLAVAVGVAGGTAAVTRLPFASILFAGLLVGLQNLDVVSAAVLAAVASWVTMAIVAGRPGRRREAS